MFVNKKHLHCLSFAFVLLKNGLLVVGHLGGFVLLNYWPPLCDIFCFVLWIFLSSSSLAQSFCTFPIFLHFAWFWMNLEVEINLNFFLPTSCFASLVFNENCTPMWFIWAFPRKFTPPRPTCCIFVIGTMLMVTSGHPCPPNWHFSTWTPIILPPVMKMTTTFKPQLPLLLQALDTRWTIFTLGP